MIGFRKVWGGFKGVWGCFGGSGWAKGGLLDPYRALFAPLEVLYGTRFGSKHHIMVQLAHVNRVGIADPFPDLWNPPRGSQKAIIRANKALLRPQ